MLGVLVEAPDGVIRKDLPRGARHLQAGVDVVPDKLLAVHLFNPVVRANTLEQVRPLGVLESLRKLHLPRKDYSKEVPRIVLHVRKKPQALEICRRYGIGLVDEDKDFLSFVRSFKKKLVEDLEELGLAADLALLAGQLTYDLAKYLHEGHVGICYKGDLVFALVERVEDKAQGQRLAEAHITHDHREAFVAFLDREECLCYSVFH